MTDRYQEVLKHQALQQQAGYIRTGVAAAASAAAAATAAASAAAASTAAGIAGAEEGGGPPVGTKANGAGRWCDRIV